MLTGALFTLGPRIMAVRLMDECYKSSDSMIVFTRSSPSLASTFAGSVHQRVKGVNHDHAIVSLELYTFVMDPKI